MRTDTDTDTANPASSCTACAPDPGASVKPVVLRTAKKPSGKLILKMLQAFMGVTQRLAPKLAVKLAALLFRTPLPTKRSARGAKVPAGVRVEMLPFENASVTLYHYPAPDDAPRVLMTHGWAGYGLQLAKFAEALSAVGWAVVLMDQPGHGRSLGWTGNLQQFSRALRFVGSHLGKLEAMVGHSMGGSAASHAVAQGLSVNKLALISSPVSLTQETHDMAKILGLSDRVLAQTIAYIEARESVPFETVEASYLAPRIDAPTLVVHDLDDTTVPHAAARTLVAYLRDPQLVTTSGLGHRRLLKEPGVVSVVAEFFGPACG
jgi:pimeloyl-ACP methyl ester carboxylesterase